MIEDEDVARIIWQEKNIDRTRLDGFDGREDDGKHFSYLKCPQNIRPGNRKNRKRRQPSSSDESEGSSDRNATLEERRIHSDYQYNLRKRQRTAPNSDNHWGLPFEPISSDESNNEDDDENGEEEEEEEEPDYDSDTDWVEENDDDSDED